jgi:hypothetical protein
MIHEESFNLYNSMNAFEIGDAKMDSKVGVHEIELPEKLLSENRLPKVEDLS